MDDDLNLNRPIETSPVMEELFGYLICHSCQQPITSEIGGQWVQEDPYTAHPVCSECLKSDDAE